MSTESTKFVIKRTDLDNDDLVIESDSLTIGSALGNDVLLNHPAVSRTHAGICKIDGAYWIKNLSTSNGTIVNGALIETIQLEDGDAIQIGVFLLKPQSDPDDGSLLLEVEKQIDSMSANNRGTQMLGGPMQAQASGKTAMLNPDLLKMLGIQMPGMPGTPPPQPGAAPGKAAPKQSATQLLGAARMQRGMTGLLSSIMALPQDEQQKFQQTMDAFWDRRKLAETGGEQKMADISVLRPNKADPEYEKFNLHLGKKQFNWLPSTDLVRPWPRGFLGTLGILVIVVAALLCLRYDAFLSPGDLAAAHQLNEFNRAQLLPGSKALLASNNSVGGNCASCHSAVTPMEQKCKTCHQTAHFNPNVIDAHAKANINCMDCHTDHKGKAFNPATVARSMCVDCHSAKPKHPKAKTAAGKDLTEPHGGNFGYPISDTGEWTWKEPINDYMKKALPTDDELTPSSKFHYVHISGREAGRARCNDCHVSLETPEEAKNIDRNKCAVCHGVQFVNIANKESKEAKEMLDKLAIKNGLDCNSCHPQHGESKDLKGVMLRPAAGKKIDAKKTLEVYTPDSVYRGGRSWNWTSFAARFGGMSFSGWLIFFSIVPLTILGFLGVDTIRRRQVQEKLKGKMIDLSNQKAWDSTSIKYAQKWESATQKANAERSSRSRPVPHPIINNETCIGCHGCILACPQDVLGFDDQEHHAIVVNFEQCMEDTGCQLACPTAPQSCVLINTKKNIREAPKPLRKGSGEGFETEHVAGVYLVGDVSGVPLIRNAIKEGRVAVDKIAEKVKAEGKAGADVVDVAIIGIGPGGIAATARAAELGLTYVALEQGRKYATIADKYPAGKYVAFNPFNPSDPPLGAVRLEGPGDLKEKMLGWWDESVQKFNIKINEFEGVTEVVPQDGIFVVKTVKNATGYKARKIILALGTAAAPRKLGVTGEKEHEAKILNRLQDPADFKGKKIIVVGAGNSAVEAAVDLTGKRQDDGTVIFPEVDGNEVSLVVRSDFPKDLTLENKMWVYYCIDKGRMKAYFGAGLKEIKEKEATLMKIRGEQVIGTIPNDFVFAMIGSEAPKGFLEKIGIKYTGWDKKKDAPKDAPKDGKPAK